MWPCSSDRTNCPSPWVHRTMKSGRPISTQIFIAKALGPGRTVEEHDQEMVALCSRRIEAVPWSLTPTPAGRQYYDCLHDRLKANADMKRWSAAASGRLPCDFRRVIDMPFDCELVFSAEGPVNGIPTLSIAFGQKGRGSMKSFEIPLFLTSLVGFCLLSGSQRAAHAGRFHLRRAGAGRVGS